MWYETIAGLLGGMGLLLYGMRLLSKALQKIAGSKLRLIMSTLTHNRISGLLAGAAVTVLFQSSTATTVILVSLTGAGLMTLKQATSVILGADIGTTVTAQLIALHVTEIALPVIGLGAAIFFFFKQDRWQRIGQVVVGFGLLLLGLKVMSDTMIPLREGSLFPMMMAGISESHLLAMLSAAVFTFLVHSSAASVGVIMIMGMQGIVDLHAAVYLLLGANIGTSFTALISGIGSSREAKRVALSHLVFKVAGAVLFYPFVPAFAELIEKMTLSPGYQVANAHAIFNITIALLFLPFTNQFVKLLMTAIPDKKVYDKDIPPLYLDAKVIDTPAIAIGMAAKEVNRTFDYIYDMTGNIIDILKKNDSSLLQQVNRKEEYVDRLYIEIIDYLTDVMRHPHSGDDFIKCMGLINIANDLEHIGDIIEKNITYLVRCKIDGHSIFSNEGMNEIAILHKNVCEHMLLTKEAFVSGNVETARKAYDMQPDLVKMEKRLRVLHIQRLQASKDSEEIGVAHMDLINALVRISEHVRNISWEVIGAGSEHIEKVEKDGQFLPPGGEQEVRRAGAV